MSSAVAQLARARLKARSTANSPLDCLVRWDSKMVPTLGNEDCHIILRGGKHPNYDAVSVDAACKELAAAGLAQRVMIDLSHSNSQKNYSRQIEVGHEVAGQLAGGDERIIG